MKFDAWTNPATGKAYALTPDPLEELRAALWRRVTGQSPRALPTFRNETVSPRCEAFAHRE